MGAIRAGLTSLITMVGLVAVGSPAEASEPAVDVIVRTDSAAALTRAEAMVRTAGGSVTQELPLIAGFAGRLPADAVSRLRGLPGVGEVTGDGQVRMKADKWIDDGGANSTVAAVKKGAGGKKANVAYLTGAGIGVALIDSGVAPVPGLRNVVNGPDLSFESQTPGLAATDTYGHGTHMAGIIAGNDPANGFEGVAPGAKLISLKVAAADGAADVSQVIAAIDWVVTHRNDVGLNIRVLNLSFGTDSSQSELLDPLSYAVEAAWNMGIVVVVSVGNDGAAATRVTMPAANPNVIAVGAADPNGTENRADDTVASFSSRGSAARHADLLAAGRSVVSLRVPGSYIDTTYPGARVGTRFFRGSGTSQAAAVVSGSVALLLQARPNLTPDKVKKLLMASADPLATADPIATGAGQLDIAGAVARYISMAGKQGFPAATGTGSLEQSRGTSHVAADTTGTAGTVLVGEQDIFGAPWNPATWAPLSGEGKAWTGGTWNGRVWSGTSWSGTSWNTAAWTTPSWTGQAWTGSNWTGRAWTAAGWTGRAWTSGSWLGRAWCGQAWL